MRKNLLLTLFFCLAATFVYSQRMVSGNVSDLEGSSLIGANVLVKGTTIGTITDIDGNFKLEVPSNQNILVISYTGYTSQEVDIIGLTSVTVSLAEGEILNELVVVGYGTQTKQQITGSVTSIKSEEIEKIQQSHVVQGLVGKVPGVQIIQQSGQPGDAPSILFRGIGSINASNGPLYVVDGIPFNGNINAIASQDIESINFLKDASANALYGSRGANGVIVITTKKGTKKGVEVTLDTKIGVSDRAVPEYDIITDPGEYYETWYNRLRIGNIINGGMSPADAAADAAANVVTSLGYNNYDVADDMVIDPSTGKLNPNANLRYQDSWQDELLSNSTRSETYLSVKSKADNLGAFMSLGYLNDEGYALNSGFDRLSARGSLDFQANDNIDFGGSLNYAKTEQDAPVSNVATNTYSNLFSWARNVAPIYPVYGYDETGAPILDANGNQVYDFGTNDDNIPGVRPYGAFNNPVATSLLDIDNNSINNFSGRAYASVDFLKNFNFRANFSADYVGQNITSFATPIGGDAKNVNGRLTSTQTNALTIATQQLVNWNKSLNDDHNIAILVGHESNNYNFDLIAGQKTENLLSDVPVLNNGANIQYLTGYAKEYSVEGYLSRVNYDYLNKIFVNASFRRDASSVFSPDNRWGNFYGLGIAYDLSQESFMDKDWINSFRVKASYGQQGNDALLYEQNRTITGDGDNRNYFAYLNQYNVVNSGGGVPGVSFVSLGNPDLIWETSTNLNAGLEGRFFNRLNLEVNYFTREVSDMIFYKPLPVSEGRGSFPDNIGDMEYKGIELILGYEAVRGNDFNLAFSLNATHYKNKVTRLPQEFIDDGNFRLEEGRSRFDYFMRQFAGVDAENGDALWFADELDDDGNPTGERITVNEFSQGTEYFIDKSAIPDLFGGFNTIVGYKDLRLDVGFAFQVGGYGFDGVYAGLLPSAGDIGHNFHKDVANTWTPENTDAELPRLDNVDADQTNGSDLFLTDLSYLSLQDITLSYDANLKFLSDIGLNTAKFYIAANNVNLWSKRQGFDPRLSTVGASSNEYSIVRTISLGTTLTF